MVIMDEPTSSLEPREVERLFDVIRLLREQQVGVVYVSHKLDEIFAICDSVTVLRDGRRVHQGPVPELDQAAARRPDARPRRRRRRGRPARRASPTATCRPPSRCSPRAALTRRHLLDDVDVDVRPGEVVGLAGLLGSGRSETVKAIFGAQAVDRGEISVGGAPVRSGSPGRALAAGIALLPEDRKAEGIVPDLSIRENIVLAALPRLTRGGHRVRPQGRRDRRDLHAPAADQGGGPGPEGQGALGRQPAEGAARAAALPATRKCFCSTSRRAGSTSGRRPRSRRSIDELAQTGLGVVLISSELEELAEGSDRVAVLQDGADRRPARRRGDHRGGDHGGHCRRRTTGLRRRPDA